MSEAEQDTSQEPIQERVRRIEGILAERYGRPEWGGPGDPLDDLMLTILSQNTNDVNRDRAWRRLREKFPAWEAVADAGVEEIAEAIKPAGLSQQKAPRMLAILHDVERRFGKMSLDDLEEWDDERVKDFLTSYPGIGPKTAACVLMFAMGRPVMPVDTHVYRVSTRLALVRERASFEEAHDVLGKITPPELVYPFHIEMIRHGRALCRPTNPKCGDCPLRAECRYYQTVVKPTLNDM